MAEHITGTKRSMGEFLGSGIWLLTGAILVISAMGFVFWDGLIRIVGSWSSDEYSHGYLIPVIALFLIWQRRADLYWPS